MSSSSPEGPRTSAGPSLSLSFIVLGIGIAIGIAGGVGTGVHFASKMMRAPAVTLPATMHRHLDAGSYEVYQRTGSRRGTSGLSFSETSPPTLSPADVTVVGPDGARVLVEPAGSFTETLSRGSATYTGAARFRVRSSGDYTIDIRADGGIPEAVVTNTLGDTFRTSVPWLGAAGLGVLTATVGLVMLIVGVVRRNRATRVVPAYASAPPPGWYPDPGGSGRPRWWDGMRWTDHVG